MSKRRIDESDGDIAPTDFRPMYCILLGVWRKLLVSMQDKLYSSDYC